jgi:(p)ppGpp synthase/HD superfamily hydrolase
MPVNIAQLVEAAEMAAQLHAGQHRKAPAGEPYINHVLEVTSLLAQATRGEDPVLLAGALLHDVLEDAPESEAEYLVLARVIETRFGAEVLALVEEVTDSDEGGEAARWRRQVEHAPHMSARARMLKIADKTSNLRDINAGQPPGWSDEHTMAYIAWAKEVVDGCRDLNPALEAAFEEAYADSLRLYCGRR